MMLSKPAPPCRVSRIEGGPVSWDAPRTHLAGAGSPRGARNHPDRGQYGK